MVTFIVGTGNKQETFIIHKQIACEHSEIWNRAFNSGFVEGQTQTYRIEDGNPEAFRLLTQWVYQEKFKHSQSGDSDRSLGDDVHNHESFIRSNRENCFLLSLWVLAEKFLIHPLQNYTIRVICTKAFSCHPHLNSAHCEYIYDNTSKGSVLRRFVIEHICWSRIHRSDSELLSYPLEALVDIIKALKKQLLENVRARKHSQMTRDDFLVEENPTTES